MCKKLIFFCGLDIPKNIALRYNMYAMNTKIILIYQIIFLFIMTLNNIWNDSKEPLLLNKAPLVKQSLH
jgi:hypothetical protein